MSGPKRARRGLDKVSDLLNFPKTVSGSSGVWAITSQPWVVLQKLSGRCALILRDIAEPRFRPLKTISWYFDQNPEFAKLQLVCHPSSRATVSRYADRYGMLGHPFDMLLNLEGRELRIPRPVCTDNGTSFLVLEFLTKAVTIESIDD